MKNMVTHPARGLGGGKRACKVENKEVSAPRGAHLRDARRPGNPRSMCRHIYDERGVKGVDGVIVG